MNTTPISPEMLPCPFCGSKAVFQTTAEFQWFKCSECNAETDAKKTTDEARAAWNTRHSASQGAQGDVERVAEVIVAAIKADCTRPDGRCYAVGGIDAMEVDGEFDPEAIAKAVLASLGKERLG